jgi:hypothetical protein
MPSRTAISRKIGFAYPNSTHLYHLTNTETFIIEGAVNEKGVQMGAIFHFKDDSDDPIEIS